VSKQHGIDIRRPEGKGPVVQLLLGLGALKHATIDENPA
jgi:hypothetical protein